MRTRIACLLLLALAQGACNPTWTKDGKPNDSSMPLPPDASAPRQVGSADGSATAPAQKP